MKTYMNDRYLFKAKRTDNGEWVEGYIFRLKETAGNRYFIFTGEFDVTGLYQIFVHHEVFPETICQCTGLTDKNGKKIWENDIVTFMDTYSTESGYAEAGCIGQVVWDAETVSFQVTERLSAESYEVLEECATIGNIFDNPELLEGGVEE